MPKFFISRFTNPPTVIFQKVEKIISKIIFLFDPPTINIICLAKTTFLGSVCVFLRVTLLKVIVLSRFLGK